MSARSLAGFFDLIERVGCVRFPASTLTEVASLAAIDALRAERVLEEGSPAEALPCPHRTSCAREVRDATEEPSVLRDAGKRWLAVCGQSPPECDGGWLDAHDVRTFVVRFAALARMTMRHLDVRRGKDELPSAWGTPGEPRAIGTEERGPGAARDVFLSLRPQTELTPAWLALRDRAPRSALVIVPTLRRISPELTARHGPMDRVELLSLDDALTTRDGAIAVSGRGAGLRVVRSGAATAAGNDRAPPSAASEDAPGAKASKVPMRKTRGLEIPAIKKWRDLRICLLPDGAVRIDSGTKYARFTAAELGLASRTTGRATRAWEVLLMTCDHGGLFTYVRFDRNFVVVRKQVSLLGLKMQALFGIDEPPFEEPRDGCTGRGSSRGSGCRATGTRAKTRRAPLSVLASFGQGNDPRSKGRYPPVQARDPPAEGNDRRSKGGDPAAEGHEASSASHEASAEGHEACPEGHEASPESHDPRSKGRVSRAGLVDVRLPPKSSG